MNVHFLFPFLFALSFSPRSCNSWLFCLAFMCRWNLYWAEHSCSRYWQVFWLSVWNRCLIPSEVFCKQIFFFCHRETHERCDPDTPNKGFHVKSLKLNFFGFFFFFSGNSNTAVRLSPNINMQNLTVKEIFLVSLQGNLSTGVRFPFRTSKMRTPFEKTPSMMPVRDLFSGSTRWKWTPYSGSLWHTFTLQRNDETDLITSRLQQQLLGKEIEHNQNKSVYSQLLTLLSLSREKRINN